MRHRVAGKKLGRSSKQRKALLKNVVRSLVLNGQVTTSLAKAKMIQGLTDKLINRAKKGDLASRRMIAKYFNRKEVTNKLMNDMAQNLGARQSGYTKMVRLGIRKGDSTMRARVEFVDKIVVSEQEKVESKPKKKEDKKGETKATKPSGFQRATMKMEVAKPARSSVKPTTQRTTSK